MIVGGTFYVIMIFGAAAMLQAEERGSAALVMVIAVMVADGVWNCLLFRPRRLDWAYWYLFPDTVLEPQPTVAVFTVDVQAGGLIATYLAFLPYDFAWTNALAKLNPHLSLELGSKEGPLPTGIDEAQQSTFPGHQPGQLTGIQGTILVRS